MASTRISPIRRRVRKVEDMPLRLRSRNSTRLNCEPTETISRAPFSAAISIATSWLVPGAGTSLKGSPSSSRRWRPGRAPVGVGVHDELGAAAQRRLAGGVHVADDHVRGQARLEQRVGAAVDGDDHRAHVPDERPQRPQVALVVDAAHDDERGAVAEVGREARQLDPAGQQLALLAHVLDRVAREALERLADLRRLASVSARTRSQVEHLAAGEQLAPAQHLRLAVTARRGGSCGARPGRRRRASRTASRRAGRPARSPPRRAAAGRGSGRSRRRTRRQFSTAAVPAAISSSAETRSMSRWSISAMSPRTRCLTSSFVRRPGRTGPATMAPMTGALAAVAAPASAGLPAGLDRVAAIPARVTRAGARRTCREAVFERLRRRDAGRVRGVARRCRRSSAPSMRTSSETTSRLAELDDRRARRLGRRVLDDREVACAERGDLRQVGDAQHLTPFPQLAQPRPDRAGGVPADARVDLVEHQRRLRRCGVGDAHDREHHPRELAAGGDLPQRPGRHAGVGRDHELDRVGARWPRLALAEHHLEARLPHRQRVELLAHRRREAPGGRPARVAQRPDLLLELAAARPRARRRPRSSATSAPASSSWRARACAA